ncbi:MAG: diguanylate cyclase [Legionellaceae bacterium]|nr:diguanylate cyclase [Legionellaceae bacterium]
MGDKSKLLVELINHGFDSLKGIFDDISNGITITDESSKILYVNPGFTNITGYSRDDAIGNNPGILHSGLQDKAFFEQMWESIHTKGRWSGEIWNRHKQGHLIPEFLTITKIQHEKQIFYFAVFSDITVLIEKNKAKLNLALTDPLTRLPNRSFLNEAFKYITSQHDRDEHGKNKIGSQVALLFADVNKFKLVNDNFGHLAGDEVLSYLASAIKSSLRGVDVAIRYGGDEFVILLNKITKREEITAICNRIHKTLEKPLHYDGNDHFVKINIGVALYPKESDSVTDLIKKADDAMYYAKKNQIQLYFHEDL